VIAALVVLAVLAHAEPVDPNGKTKNPIAGAIQKMKDTAKDFIKGKPSSSRSSSKSSSSSAMQKVDPAKVAKEMVAAFGDADGSAYFRGNKIDPKSVAEVPPKKTAGKKHKLSGSIKGSRSGSSGSSSRSSSRSSSSRHGSSVDERLKRPLFNFRTVPRGFNAVGIRKVSFRNKHFNLVRRFVNANAKVTLVIVIDKFVGPKGRPSKKHHDRRRGHKQSEFNIDHIQHNNLFVYDEAGKKLFPNKGSSSSSGSRRPASGSRGSADKAKGKGGMMDKLKQAMKKPFSK